MRTIYEKKDQFYGQFRDLIEMVEAGDETVMVLHWECDDSEPTRGTARQLLEEVIEVVDKMRDADEVPDDDADEEEKKGIEEENKFKREKAMDSADSAAYIMTLAEYEESEAELEAIRESVF